MTTLKSDATATPKKTRKKKGALEIPPELLAIPRSEDQFRLALRRKTRMLYDMQMLRLQTQGRLTKKSDKNPIELHPVDLLKLEARLDDLKKAENMALKDLEEQLYEIPFYTQKIKGNPRYRGLGPKMSACILSLVDIHKAVNPSQVWSYAGLAPVPAARCRFCNVVLKEDGGVTKHPAETWMKCSLKGKEMPPDTTYASGKKMMPVKGETLHYNPWLRSKLCGVLGPVMLQLGSPYRKVYDDYKHRMVSSGKGVSDAHRHQAAIRVMIKMLLLDLWTDWRLFLGLVARPSYQVEKLGHVYSGKPIGSDGNAFEESEEVDEEVKVLADHE